jgi:hypothetical protein
MKNKIQYLTAVALTVDVFAEIGPALAWYQMFVAKSPAASVSDFGFKH